MLVELKSTKQVGIDISNPSIQKTIYCQIDNFIQEEGGYRINGKYIYKTEIIKVNEEDEQTHSEIILRQFSKQFTNNELNNLYNSLKIEYPEDVTYTEMSLLELTKGLKYIVNSESMFGLTGTDWE